MDADDSEISEIDQVEESMNVRYCIRCESGGRFREGGTREHHTGDGDDERLT